MKKLLFLALILLVLIFKSHSQNCQNIGTRNVVIYDLNVHAQVEDTTTVAIANYWKLFMIIKGVGA